MRNKHALLILLIFIICNSSFAQKKLFSKLFSGKKDTTRSASFLALPAIGYAQETGFAFGAASLYSFYTDKADPLSRSSVLTGTAILTTKKQSDFHFKADIWGAGNKCHYIGEVRYKNFPLYFYGIGNNTLQADEEDLVIQKKFRLNADIEKKTSRISYTGLDISFENYRFEDKEPGGIFSANSLINGRDGGKALFIGVSQIADSRNSNTYTTRGTYLKLNYAYAPNLFGNDSFEGSFTKLDLRTFKSFNNTTVAGIHANYQTVQGNNTPFYLLPQLGNDQLMRGYYGGRYRDQNLLALQTELRYRFNPRLGIVGFLGGGMVYSSGTFNLTHIKPSYGGGFRYFFDIERGLSLRVDYGFGEKRTQEKRQRGIYISLGEAF